MGNLRYAVHRLRRSPGYTLMCLSVLALGIGANVAIFSVLDAMVLHSLPYPRVDQLVFLWERFAAMPAPFDKRMQVAHKSFVEWRKQNTVFSEVAAFLPVTQAETVAGQPRQVSVAFTSASLFPLLGVQARVGRLFDSAEERVAVISDSFFDRRFQRSAAAIGQSITLNGTAYNVIGVLPPRFHLPSTHEGSNQISAEVWAPLSPVVRTEEAQTRRQLTVAARMKPGVTLERARAEMQGIAERLSKSEPRTHEGWSSSVFSFQTEDAGPDVRRALYVLMAAVGFLLLIACANLANLTLARATMRSREIAVRLAMGATRARIVWQLVTESLLVSLAGAALGLLLAHWSIPLMLSLQPDSIHRPELIGINPFVFLFALAASVLTTVLIGMFPAITVSRADLSTALKSGAWGASAARLRSRQFLIAFEVAVALVLVVGAGLTIRSFRELLHVGIGFETSQITMADVELPEARYRDGASRSRFFGALLEHAASRPGMAVAVVDNAPLHSVSLSNFLIAGRPEPPISALPMSDKVRVSPNYFDVVGLRLETGRGFTGSDLAITEKGASGIAIVNRAFVRQFFPNENPIGQRLLEGSNNQHSSEIVGVVSDWRPMGVENGVRPTIFWPDLRVSRATVVVRSSMAQQRLADEIRKTIWAADKHLPAAKVLPMQHYVDEWLSSRKFVTLLLGVFASLALALGMLGIYGILAHLVASRVREIGIRMAIGATPRAIGKLVFVQSVKPVAAGLAVGLAGSMVLTRFLESLLFQVKPRDPATLILSACAILAVVPLAISVPLRRALRVDCTVALRQE